MIACSTILWTYYAFHQIQSLGPGYVTRQESVAFHKLNTYIVDLGESKFRASHYYGSEGFNNDLFKYYETIANNIVTLKDHVLCTAFVVTIALIGGVFFIQLESLS
jgi:hypothetical protein